jgi:hypothetical protein
MSFLGKLSGTLAGFFSSHTSLRLLFMVILGIIAAVEFFSLGLARRTFVFYTVNSGEIVVEDRMMKYADSREGDIIRYTEETLLGPSAPDLLPLFPLETRLSSLLYRNGVVYADFTADAILPPEEGGTAYGNFHTLYAGILRNFSYVKDVEFFIEGPAVYYEKF